MYKVIYQIYMRVGQTSVQADRVVEFTTFDEACSLASKHKGAVYKNDKRLLKYN
jgi:hypothetical protein